MPLLPLSKYDAIAAGYGGSLTPAEQAYNKAFLQRETEVSERLKKIPRATPYPFEGTDLEKQDWEKRYGRYYNKWSGYANADIIRESDWYKNLPPLLEPSTSNFKPWQEREAMLPRYTNIEKTTTQLPQPGTTDSMTWLQNFLSNLGNKIQAPQTTATNLPEIPSTTPQPMTSSLTPTKIQAPQQTTQKKTATQLGDLSSGLPGWASWLNSSWMGAPDWLKF